MNDILESLRIQHPALQRQYLRLRREWSLYVLHVVSRRNNDNIIQSSVLLDIPITGYWKPSSNQLWIWNTKMF